MADPVPLQYSPAPPSRRRWAWRSIVLVLLVGAGAAAWHWLPDFQRWQSKVALRHDVLVANVSFNAPVISITPNDSPDHWLDKAVAKTPDDRLWRHAYADLAPMLQRDRSGVLLFVHQRTTVTGHKQLVMIDYLPMVFPDQASVSIDVRLFDPGTLWRPQFQNVTVSRVDGMPLEGTVPGWPGAICGLARIDWGHAFSLSVGRPDPVNASQFIFDYTIDRHAGQIIGKVGDGGVVSFSTVDGSPLPLHNLASPTTQRR